MFPSPRAQTTITGTGNVLDLGSGLLPNEILGAIFDYLSPDALARVALVSRRWRANAERVLYTTITLHEVLPRASVSLAPASFATAGPALAEQQQQQQQPSVELKKDFHHHQT